MTVNRIITTRRTIPLEQGLKGTNTYAGALRSLASHLINTGEDLDEALGRVTPLDMELLHELAHEILEYRDLAD